MHINKYNTRAESCALTERIWQSV